MSVPAILARVADELDRMQHEFEELGARLCADPAFVRTHMADLQKIDEFAQRHRHLAEVLRSPDPMAAVSGVTLQALAHRLAPGELPPPGLERDWTEI